MGNTEIHMSGLNLFQEQFHEDPVEEAFDMVLCQHVIHITPGEFNEPGSRRGHALKITDIPHLLSLRKEHVRILKNHSRRTVCAL